MPNLTEDYFDVYDAIRVERMDIVGDLELLNDGGTNMDTITTGWLPREISQEQSGGRQTELHVLDREGFSDQANAITFFEYDGFRYERADAPNPPVNNPREWVWLLKPVGVV